MKAPITIERVLVDFDTTGAGSTRSADPVLFRDMRRMWDMHGCYPLGGRWKSLAFIRGRELAVRAALASSGAVNTIRAGLGRQAST